MNPLCRLAHAALVAVLAVLIPASGSHAATYTWTGGDGNWFSSGQTLSGNWTPSGGTLTPADSLVFDLASLAYQINQNGNAQVTNLTVVGDPIVEFRDYPLTISGSLVTQGTVEFYNPVGFVNGAVVDTNSLSLYRLVGSGNFTTLGNLGVYDQASYSGTMTISQGTVEVSDTGFGGNIVNNGGIFSLGRNTYFTGSYVQSSGTGMFYDGVGSVNQTGGLISFYGDELGENVVGSLAGSGGTIDIHPDVTLTIGDASSTTYAGSIVGSGSISKVGSGSLTLGGTSTYTGPTTVSAGRLLVNGALGTSPVTVLAAAELGGSGASGGPVSVAAGGTLSPGSSIESLATGTATFAAGATFAYEVDSTNPLSLGGAADLLVVSGNLNLDTGNATILTVADLAGSPSPFVNHTTIFALINYSGTWNGGLFTYGGVPLADGGTFTVGSQDWLVDYNRTSAAGLDNFTGDYLPSSRFVTITAVPEPSTYAMALAGIACGGFSMWRRRKRA